MTTQVNELDLSSWQERKLEAVMNAACQVFPRRYRPDGCNRPIGSTAGRFTWPFAASWHC